MDKSRINVSYKTKNHKKRQFRANYMNSNWQKNLDKNETNEYWLNEGQDHINSGQKSFNMKQKHESWLMVKILGSISLTINNGFDQTSTKKQ